MTGSRDRAAAANVDVSARRRREIIDALRRGTVPSRPRPVRRRPRPVRRRHSTTSSPRVEPRRRVFKAVRGEYGSGKTFFARWLAERAKRRGFAVSRGADLGDRDAAAPAGDRLPATRRTPLHRTVPAQRAAPRRRRLVLRPRGGRPRRREPSAEDDAERAGTPPWTSCSSSGWPTVARSDPRLRQPRCAATGEPLAAGDRATADGLIAWLGGQPNVAAAGQARGGRQRRPRPLRRARLPAGPAHRAARLRASRACCSCSTRSRPCSGSAATSATRPSTRCGSSSTRSTPAASPASTSSSPARRPSTTVSRASSGWRRSPSGSPPTSRTDPRFDNPRAVQIRLPGFDHRRSARTRRQGPRPVRGRQRRPTRVHAGRRRLRRGAGPRRHRQAGRTGRRRAADLPQEARRRRPRPGRPVRRLRPPAALRPHRARQRTHRRRAQCRHRRPRRLDRLRDPAASAGDVDLPM